jgi:hypothetical protein
MNSESSVRIRDGDSPILVTIMKIAPAVSLMAFVITCANAGTIAAQTAEVSEGKNDTTAAQGEFRSASETSAALVDIELSRRGSLRVALKETTLDLVTPYGELKVPAAEIHSIEFATRLSDTETASIATALSSLASSAFGVREEATNRLLALEHRAYPALVRASKDADAEVAKRAAALVSRLESTVPSERLKERDYDVVETAHSKISGKLRAETIAVATTEFGPQNLRLADIRNLRSERARPAGLSYLAPEADPGNMTRYQGQIGKTFAFHVTGRADSTVYGTGVYTYDSTIAVAAVHCGVLKAGEAAVIHVQMVASPASFTASTQNGVTSASWTAYPSAFKILGKGPATP